MKPVNGTPWKSASMGRTLPIWLNWSSLLPGECHGGGDGTLFHFYSGDDSGWRFAHCYFVVLGGDFLAHDSDFCLGGYPVSDFRYGYFQGDCLYHSFLRF